MEEFSEFSGPDFTCFVSDFFIWPVGRSVEFCTPFKTGLSALLINSYGRLCFFPALQIGGQGRPKVVWRSFASLKPRYPLVTCLLLLGNCCRQLPMNLLSSRPAKMKGRFALGFLLGVGVTVFKISAGGYRA